MLLQVSQSRQSGPFSFSVKYVAEVEVTPSDPQVKVDILSTIPPGADPALVARASESIRRGAEFVLRPRREGASMRVQRLYIHDIDFSPPKFEQITAEELSRLWRRLTPHEFPNSLTLS